MRALEVVRVLELGLCGLLSVACTQVVESDEGVGEDPSGKADGRGIEGVEGPSASTPRIVGGERTPDYPAVVALLDDQHGHFCTGTLIGERTVLTAAHCIDEWVPVSAVYFGSDAELCARWD